MRFHTARGYDVAENLERRIDGTKQAMKFAYSLGASVVINQIGSVPEKPEGETHNMLVQCLTIGAIRSARRRDAGRRDRLRTWRTTGRFD